MPGSLFPRSPSLQTDSPPRSADDGDERRVQFAYETENEAGPSRPRDIPRTKTSFEKSTSGSHSSTASVSPLTRRGVPSVRDAVRRFRVGEEDADASILLPRETVSPGKNKGKEKVRDEVPTPSPISLRNKGKERAQEGGVPESECGYDNVRAAETSGDVRVRGKERELVEAREEHMRKERRREREKDRDTDSVAEEEKERERGRDKERIRMLEEEIRMLKEEVNLTSSFG
jgi:hypothetical protein